MAKGTKEYSVPALDKAIMILNALSEKELSAVDLHTSLKLPKTTTFVILNTLEQHAIIYKNLDGTYRLGPGVLHWANRFLGSVELVQFARPHLSALVQDTPFTGHLAVLVDNKAVYCDKVEGNGFVRFATSIGQGQPLHQSAVGKALLADHHSKDLELLLPEKSSVDESKAARMMEKWSDDIQFVKDHGFSIEDEEFEEGVRCIGAPIRNHQGFIVAAISITSLSRDLPAVKFMSIGNDVKNAALTISKAIGYTSSISKKSQDPVTL